MPVGFSDTARESRLLRTHALDRIIADMPPMHPELPVSALLLLGLGFAVPWSSIRSVVWVIDGFAQNRKDSANAKKEDHRR